MGSIAGSGRNVNRGVIWVPQSFSSVVTRCYGEGKKQTSRFRFYAENKTTWP